LNEEEHELLRLGPRFIYDDPQTAARRRTLELAMLKRKIQARFFEKRASPGRPVDQFIDELDLLLQRLHNVPCSSSPLLPTMTRKGKGKNYHRLVKRLKYKMKMAKTVLRKTDKSKVFHLGKEDDYDKKSKEYMDRTQAYKCLGTADPLPDLIQRTNKYLLNLRLAKWITQKQYELLSLKPDKDEIELAHLYYLPKAHKPTTPLRPIIAGLRHPTVKISKFLDDLFRPLFDQMAKTTTVASGFELVKQLHNWSEQHWSRETLLCTIDVADLYTMIPQVEGVLSLKKMLDHLQLKRVEGLNVETILRLSRFVMQNNYFSYEGRYYRQIRGGAMGSPLTLTMANCYMYFFEQEIVRQVHNSHGLYFRFIDDIFLVINWSQRELLEQVERWNGFDMNIQLLATMGSAVNFLDLSMENRDGQLVTKVFHKPSHEPYFLPFNSIHPLHMKKNIPFAMLLRAVRYCSSFHLYIEERESLRMALLLNKYPHQLITEQFQRVFSKYGIDRPVSAGIYSEIRTMILSTQRHVRETLDYEHNLFVHFTYCSSMRTFPRQFHSLWQKYFGQSPINEIRPILGTRNVDNLERQLTTTRSLALSS
jgi:hypothetical protein